MGYISLHTHSEHSELDGLASVRDYVAAAVADEQDALAITDHGALSGAWQLATECEKAGIKPIVGEEFYLAFGSRRAKIGEPVDPDDEDSEDVGTKTAGQRTTKADKRYMHITVLARTETGWSNLVRLHNDAAAHVWYKPRTDLETLAKHGDGLIVLTGCLGGPLAFFLNKAVLAENRGDHDVAERHRTTARANLQELVAAVGHENVYVEVMDHSIPAQQRVTPELRALAEEFDLPLVATNDAHYCRADEGPAHEAWLAVGSKKTLDDPKRFRFHGHGHHFRTEDEMRALFDGADWWQEAVDNTVHIAQRCAPRTLPSPRTRLPHYPVPDGYTDTTSLLKDRIAAGAVERYGSGTQESVKDLPEDVRNRLSWEFKVIKASGFGDYFLIVADVITWARSQGILVGPGRGSAAGSIAAYCLGITNLCPLRHSLLFERFLDPARAGLPDIDVDFQQSRRAEVHDYFARRWGHDRVAALGTFGVARSKDAIKRAARALGYPPAETNKLTKKYPMDGAKPYPMARALDPADPATESLRHALERDEAAREVFDLARGIEDTIFGKGKHACGVVLSDEPLDALVPMRHDGSDATALRITEWEGADIEAFGLVKMDFLVLRNLDIAHTCVRMIADTTGELVDVNTLDPDQPPDPDRAQATWDMLCAGRTAGVFQLESAGMTRLAEQVGPQSIDDLSALVALFRPGPLGAGMHTRYADRKNGREQVSYDYLTTEPGEQQVIAQVLDETYGVICFQEQLMILGEKVAGFTAAQKNRLRKAVSKKKADEVAAVGKMWFASGAEAHVDEEGTVVSPAFSQGTLERLWTTFQASAAYLFNKSHSAAYGLVSYVTAYLKANWPLQYAAAILACTDDDDKRRGALVECAAESIEVAAPDVNLAQRRASTDGRQVVYGLAEVKGVGEPVADAIVAEREERGPFTSLADFVTRVHTADGKALQSGVVEALIMAGALDTFGPRLGMAMVARAAGAGVAIPDAEWGVVDRSAAQRTTLGVALGTHPLVLLRDQIKAWRPEESVVTPVPLTKVPTEHGELTTTIGVLADWSERTYSGGRMASGRVEGSAQTKEIVAFDRALKGVVADLGSSPEVGDLVAVRGRVEVREREVVEVDEEGVESVRTETTSSLVVQSMWRVAVDDPTHPAELAPGPSPRLRVVRGDAPPDPTGQILDFDAEPLTELEPVSAPTAVRPPAAFRDPAPLSAAVRPSDVVSIAVRWSGDERDFSWSDAVPAGITLAGDARSACADLKRARVPAPPSAGTWVTRVEGRAVAVNAWARRERRLDLAAPPHVDARDLLPGRWASLEDMRALTYVS